MCDLRQANGKYCNKANVYWLQYEIAHDNILTCRTHFARAYDAMVKFRQSTDNIVIKLR